MTIAYLSMFVLSGLLSIVFTRGVRNFARSRGWLVAAVSDHHVHTEPVPRLGGVAIFSSFLIVTAVVFAGASMLRPDLRLQVRTVLYVLGPGAIVFLLGLYDDFRPVKPAVKFAVQAIAATILFYGGFGVFSLPLLFGAQHSTWIGLPLTILWVLWITNAFNLVDGVDGLAAGSALFSTLAVFIVSLASGSPVVSLLAVGLAGAVLGFLRFNFNPATIFLGDCGSLFIGFILCALGAVGAGKAQTILAVAIPVVSFGLPVLETALSVVRRWLSGQPLFGADTQHIHHKLLERGLSQRQVVITLYGVSAAFAMLSLFLLYPGGTTVGMVFFVIGAIVWVGIQHLGYHEFFELGRVATRTLEQRRVIVNNLAVRRGTAALTKVQSIDQLRRVMQDAFESSDFDGFKLILHSQERRQRGNIDGVSQDDSSYRPTESSRRFDFEPLIEWRKANDSSSKPERVSGNGNGNRKESNGSAQHANWTLTLELMTTDARRLGSFTLYRRYNSNSLPLDVNLLIAVFPHALAEAVDRVAFKAGLNLGEAPADRKIAAVGRVTLDPIW